MKKDWIKISILTIIIFVLSGLITNIFGQSPDMTKKEFKEFDENIKLAAKNSEETFPRREIYSDPTKMEVRSIGDKNSSYFTLGSVAIREFAAKDKIRYEYIEINSYGTIITKRLQIGSVCYDLDGEQWNIAKISCDPQAGTGTAYGSSEKNEYSAENSKLDSKPVLIYRNIRTGKVYSDGALPYIDEFVYYVDSAGRLLKEEVLSRRGNGKSTLTNSTKYEYDVNIEPIAPPVKKTGKRG